MDGPAPLPDDLEATRRIMLLCGEITVAADRAIADAGFANLAANASVVVLLALAHDGATRPRDLLGPTGLTRGGLSNLFERLESEGLVERTYGTVPGDRRGVTVELTPAGRAAAESIDRAVLQSIEDQHETVAAIDAELRSIGLDGAAGMTDASPARRVELLGRAGAAFTRALAELDDDDPTPMTTAVVLLAATQPGSTRPGTLARRLGLSSSGVTQVLDRLEGAGLVTRSPGVTDRRAVVVRLTPAGRVRMERQLAALAEQLPLLRAGFDVTS